MRSTLLVAIPLLLAAPAASADYYQWVDGQGVTHFTDSRSKVPKQYRDKVRRLELAEEPAPSAPARQAAPRAANPPAGQDYGGHAPQWWRQRFARLRGELKTLQQDLPAKQDKLVELRRKRVIFTRAQDREAVNKMQAEISANEARIAELQRQIAALELDAAKAAVPVEWRQ